MAIDIQVLELLKTYDYGWQGDLPSSVRFKGHDLSIEFETRVAPAKRLPPRPSPSELELARQILAGIAEVVAVAEQRFQEYESSSSETVVELGRPQIWISREEQAREGLDFWTLVVESEVDSDYATHIEFHGLEYRAIWAGD